MVNARQQLMGGGREEQENIVLYTVYTLTTGSVCNLAAN